MKIAIFGAGYVGFGNALLLAQKHIIRLFDVNQEKVDLINAGVAPIEDHLILEYFKKYKKNISACHKINKSINNFSFCLIATPTNFNNNNQAFDTSSIDKILKDLKAIGFKNNIIIRSTLPVGYTELISRKFKKLKISFFPEFLREGYALYDNLYPSRIIAGGTKENTKKFVKLLLENAKKTSVPVLFTSASEAEAIKLFSNAYLAMRVSFFNELDSFAMEKDLDTKNIIMGISHDKRIGNHYNNPSFGYGGYCLPKDTKQLSKNFTTVPHQLIKAITASNQDRKRLIANFILNKNLNKVGIYRLTMKSDSDNFRDSAILDIIKILKTSGIKISIFEPKFTKKSFLGCKIENNLEKFLDQSELVLANRISKELRDSVKPILSRDIFNKD